MALSPLVPGALARALQGWPGQSLGAGVFRMRATWSLETFADGTTVPMARIRAMPGHPSRGTLPAVEVEAGQSALIILHNQLPFPVQPAILDHVDGPLVAPGRIGLFHFTAPAVGTWLLGEKTLGPVAGSLGLGAVVVSRPRQQPIRPGVDVEYTLLYHDTDSGWNNDVWSGRAPDTRSHAPDYFTVNGLEYPALTADPDSRVVCEVGQNVLLRVGNLGQIRHAIHFHGHHAEILEQDRVPETALPAKDTIALPRSSTAEILMPVTQPGLFPFHPHHVPAATANGLYPFGQIALIDAR